MFAKVLLLNGFKQPLIYRIPNSLSKKITVGSLVKVPLKTTQQLGYVVKVYLGLKAVDFEIREILELEHFPGDVKYAEFISKISRFYFVSELHFYQRIRGFFTSKKADKVLAASDVSKDEFIQDKKVILTNEQRLIVEFLNPFLKRSEYLPLLIHGVTNSGKTEVYKALIEECIKNRKSVVMLHPEVSLSLQFERIFKASLHGIKILGFHSASRMLEKRVLWDLLLKGEPLLILGVHMPITLPINNLGLIIVDEEHEHGFFEKKHPKLNSKEIAIWRANIYKIPIVLGSATPSLSSLYNVDKKGWRLFKITKRFSGQSPVIQKLVLRSQREQNRWSFWVSRELEEAIKNCLARKEQVIIYLNRRGYSFFVQCGECGFIFRCVNCSVSLTLHMNSGHEFLRCHYCDFHKSLPKICPDCKSDHKNFLKRGVGTQQAVKIFQELFPQAVVARVDLDTTSKKRLWYKTVELFEQGKIDILVGTQTVTKGYHFPRVTLVGILWADLNLHMPFYNAAETSLQQLIQVAGRAGRDRLDSRVIVQTMQEHKIFDYLNEFDYLKFCADEIEIRSQIFYPPFCRLAQIEIRHNSVQQLETDTTQLMHLLQSLNENQLLGLKILGPAYPVISKVKNVEIRQIFLKAKTFASIHKLLEQVDFEKFQSKMFVVTSL